MWTVSTSSICRSVQELLKTAQPMSEKNKEKKKQCCSCISRVAWDFKRILFLASRHFWEYNRWEAPCPFKQMFVDFSVNTTCTCLNLVNTIQYIFSKCMFYHLFSQIMILILLLANHPCLFIFFFFFFLFSNQNSSEMTDFTLVKYAGVLQSFSLLKH